MKIAFHAKLKMMSVTEHFVTAIIKSYRALRKQELINEGLWDDFDYDNMDGSQTDDIGDKLKKQ